MEKNKILFRDPKKMSLFINSNSEKDILLGGTLKEIKKLSKNYK